MVCFCHVGRLSKNRVMFIVGGDPILAGGNDGRLERSVDLDGEDI